jgi:hypothetical protein
MLVALALMGLAAALMLEGLGSAQRLWAGEATRIGRSETIAAAQATLRARLERLYPATRFNGAASYTDVEGGERWLAFLAPPADAERPAAAQRFRLALSDRGELLLGVARPRVDETDPTVYRDTVMLRDVKDLDVSYYGPGPDGGVSQWWSDWSRRPAPPAAVRVKVTFGPDDRRTWPELIVHPAATVDTLCSLDPATGLCRGRE